MFRIFHATSITSQAFSNLAFPWDPPWKPRMLSEAGGTTTPPRPSSWTRAASYFGWASDGFFPLPILRHTVPSGYD